ncbi:MAG: DNA translocase FtsK [Candidatus Pelagibacter sp.]
MSIKSLLQNISSFIINRLIQLFGIFLAATSILLVIALLTYTASDPNFVYSNNNQIQNALGFNGSVVSDFFLQSIGLISFLLTATLFVTGINIFFKKELKIILQNFFYVVLYIFFGTIFLAIFYFNSFWLPINGNGGFIGNTFSKGFVENMLLINKDISYYFMLISTLLLFFKSINFSIKSFVNLVKKITLKKKQNTSLQNKVINNDVYKSIDEEQVESVQENFSFNQNTNQNKITKLKYKQPSIEFLNIASKEERSRKSDDQNYDSNSLEKILLDFGVEGKIKKVSNGPVVTLNEFEPAAGVKVSKVINLSEDIARNTSSESARISTIPGQNTIGIELPNTYRENVYLSEIISSPNFKNKDIKLPIALGKSISGIPITGDLSSMPHLLIAGTTGSGKSVCINTIILSLLYKHSPDKCKFILIDPKMLELSTYEGIPHLLCPVITEAKKAASVLGWVVKEMESRYKLMTREGVKNIDGYNTKHSHSMPYIIVIVDEMSDLMLVAGKEIENYIQKLSQMARAAGIHIIMATQRPSVDVITGTIKANFPTRISFQVTSKIDSRTILGEQGAEQLLGKGDMLYMSSANRIIRIHAPYVSETEIDKINNFIRSQAEPDYVDEILNFADERDSGMSASSDNKDDLYVTAVDIIKTEGKASTSFLQRKLQIGYNRAARIIDMMEQEGIVSKANHVGKRDVLK